MVQYQKQVFPQVCLCCFHVQYHPFLVEVACSKTCRNGLEKNFIEGASGHDVVAVPACEVEGVPEHDVLLDRDCICHGTVVVAAMRQGDFDTRCTAVMDHNYKHLEIQIKTENDAHGSEDW